MTILNKQKVTLHYEYTDSNDEMLHEIKYTISSDETWDQMMQHYINFLRSIGYVIPEDEDRV